MKPAAANCAQNLANGVSLDLNPILSEFAAGGLSRPCATCRRTLFPLAFEDPYTIVREISGLNSLQLNVGIALHSTLLGNFLCICRYNSNAFWKLPDLKVGAGIDSTLPALAASHNKLPFDVVGLHKRGLLKVVHGFLGELRV